jgi:hypothetical protein
MIGEKADNKARGAYMTSACRSEDIKLDTSFVIMAEQKQLWEINDVILNNNYSSQDTDYGLYYSLATSRADLPAGFYASERYDQAFPY